MSRRLMFLHYLLKEDEESLLNKFSRLNLKILVKTTSSTEVRIVPWDVINLLISYWHNSLEVTVTRL